MQNKNYLNDNTDPVLPIPDRHENNNGALIGGLVGGILGFLLLLALLGLLLYLCCRKRRQNKDRNIITQSTTYIYPMPLVQTDNFGSSITTTYLPTSSVTLMDNKSQYSTSNCQQQLTDVRTSTYDIDHNVAVHSVVPDIYASKRCHNLSSRGDFCDDNISVRFECNNLYNDDCREYVTDEEFFHQTSTARDYYVQNYQQQQNDINVHYV